MSDLTLAMQNLIASGEISFGIRDAAVTLAAEQAKSTPSRGQIAARVLAGIVSHEGGYAEAYVDAARQAVKYADALLAELAKPRT